MWLRVIAHSPTTSFTHTLGRGQTPPDLIDPPKRTEHILHATFTSGINLSYYRYITPEEHGSSDVTHGHLHDFVYMY